MRKFILLLLGIICTFNVLKAQETVNINGTLINLDEIPLNRSLDITAKVHSKNIANGGKTLAFASDNKEYIAIASYNTNTISKTGYKNIGELKIYNSKGSLLWEVQEEYFYIVKCKIENNAQFTHVVWTDDTDIEDSYILKSYDIYGKEIYRANSHGIYLSDDYSQIYHIQENSNLEFEIVYKDLKSNKTWVKNLKNIPPRIYGVCRTGDRLFYATNKLYCINNSGNIIWENSELGIISLSNDCNRVIKYLSPGHIKIIDIRDDSVIYEKSNYNSYLENFKPHLSSYVKNSNGKYIMVGGIGRLKYYVLIFNESHEKIGELIVENINAKKRVFAIENNSIIEIFFNGIKVGGIKT